MPPSASVLDRARGWLSVALAHPLAAIVLLFALSRALLLVIGALTVNTVDAGVANGWPTWVGQLLCRWDCGWYMTIADLGYSTAEDTQQPGASTLAFFPAYPMLVRAFAAGTGLDLLIAAIALSNLCFLAALVYLHRYVQLLGYSRRCALLSVALLCFVPQGFVFMSAYTESLFLLLLLAAMVHLRQGNFLLAGLAAALLSATRSTGIFFVFFALFWLLRNHGLAALLRPWRRPELFVPIVLAPLGLFCFWAYCFYLSGDAFAQSSSIGHGWGWHLASPLDNLITHLRIAPLSRYWALASLAVFAISLLLLRLRLYEEFGFCLLVFLLLWSGNLPNSLLRYSIVLFPVWIALARHLEDRPLTSAGVFAGFGLLNGFLMTAWTLGKLIAI